LSIARRYNLTIKDKKPPIRRTTTGDKGVDALKMVERKTSAVKAGKTHKANNRPPVRRQGRTP